jgi:pimeloyl-ACP methyl ester carboxylesterase
MKSEAISVYDATSTQFVNVKGVDFAYRRFGAGHGPPLVLMTHFRASMDNWDPALLDAIAAERTVIAFDNRGVARTGGTTPGTYHAMADDASDFIAALGYDEVDILGFSIGGAIAQEMLIHQPGLIRKAVLAASMPPGGKGILGSRPEIAAVATKTVVELDDFLILFFEPTPTSQKLGRDYLARRSARTIDVEPATGAQTMQGQGEARKAWAEMDPEQGRVELGKVVHPVLVANGKNDVMLGSANSVLLFNTLPAAQLILYPDAGHGFLFQYPELFVRHLSIFLDC